MCSEDSESCNLDNWTESSVKKLQLTNDCLTANKAQSNFSKLNESRSVENNPTKRFIAYSSVGQLLRFSSGDEGNIQRVGFEEFLVAIIGAYWLRLFVECFVARVKVR